MKKLPVLALIGGLVFALSVPAAAQRRIIGAEEREPDDADKKDDDKKDDEKKDEKAKDPAAAKKKAEEEEKKKKKKEAEAKAKEEEAERKAAAKAAAEEAAEKAAAEAAQKKKDAEEKKKAEAERKEQKRLEDNRAQRLKSAKAMRRYSREDDAYAAGITVTPGKAEKDKLLELRFELSKQLKVAHPKYGDRMPLKGWRVIATVTEPATEKGEQNTYQYLVQPLTAPGSFGFHHTPRIDGETTITVEATHGDDRMSFSLPVHVGAWPPPDFEDEEANNAKAAAGRAAGSRRILGSK